MLASKGTVWPKRAGVGWGREAAGSPGKKLGGEGAPVKEERRVLPPPTHTWQVPALKGPPLPRPAGVFPSTPGLAPGHRQAPSDACLGSISADAILITL